MTDKYDKITEKAENPLYIYSKYKMQGGAVGDALI